MATLSPLRRRFIEDMTVRNLSPATQQSYVYAVAKFSRFFDNPSTPATLALKLKNGPYTLPSRLRSVGHLSVAMNRPGFVGGSNS